MKPDGVTMETTEPTEAAAIAEPSNPPDNTTEQSLLPPVEATGDGAPKTAASVNGKTAAKPKSATMRKLPPQSKTETASGSRPAVASRRPVNDVKPSNNVAARSAPAKKPTAPSVRLPGATTGPKKTQVVSLGKTMAPKPQVKLPDKKASAPGSAAPALPNGTKPTNGTPKKTLATTKPKLTGPAPRPIGSAAPNQALPLQQNQMHLLSQKLPDLQRLPQLPAQQPNPPQLQPQPSRSPQGTAAPPPKTAGPAKKDVSQPSAAAASVMKKTPQTAAKKTEISKSARNEKPGIALTTMKVDPKPPKPQQMIKPSATKKPAAARITAVNRIGQTPPSSPVCKSPSTSNTPRSKVLHKPTQAVSPFTVGKKAEKMGATKAAAAASKKAVVAGTAAVAKAAGVTVGAAEVVAAVVQDTQVEPVPALSQEESTNATGSVEDSATALCPFPFYTRACPSSISFLSSDFAPTVRKTFRLNLNDDEEEEEKEGSQLVSVSEMSGTTQPTEESRPGSAGTVGGICVESRVPEIPVNDYDEDDEDENDNDRVCDMDVGSERADEPQRRDNDVDDEEDEDVEMASEGSGTAPTPSSSDPSAPAAQWDQPNPFSDPWAEHFPQQPPPEADSELSQVVEAAADSPLTDPCQGDSETPTQESTQAWIELCSATITNTNQDDTQTFSDKGEQQTPEPQIGLEQTGLAAEPMLPVDALCAAGSSPLRISSCGATSPEEHNGVHNEKDVQVPQSSPQPELAQTKEPEHTPADELLASANAPASNPSSSSVTDDEASDTEGEAQLEDSLETPVICDVTFESKPQGTRLSTVDEGDEPEDSGPPEDATPPSATSQVSYGFDTMTSASNSNAQSTGESCVKSPGIFL
ncbi:hypothetical protein WMY93_006299 [Mugilogobius chulae]|uniref:Uncharacterized protein n=1 Tax=Mugilogobius chulae TaxID=88201 RepID=A0AAW0PVB5_9GOBI